MVVVYEIQCQACYDFYFEDTARSFGVRFKEHVTVTRASTTAVKTTTSSILAGEDNMFTSQRGHRNILSGSNVEQGRGYELQLSTWTFCHMIHSINYVENV